MNKIKKYQSFNEEISIDYFKGLLTGVKTDDDKLAKKILKDIDSIDFSYGGLYPHTLYFTYNGYRFSCMSGSCTLYGDKDKIEIESKFLRDLYENGIRKAYDKRDKEYELEKEKERKELEKETINFIKSNGYLDSLLNEFIYSIFDYNKKRSYTNLISKYDWVKFEGGVRYDGEDNKLLIVAPYDLSKNLNIPISSIIFDFNNLELKIDISHKRYSNYREYRVIVEKSSDWYNILNQIKNEVIEYKSLKDKDYKKQKSNILKKFFK